ncbi:hypothetical protein NIES267_04750 [Calothrix parasitica NIES-267]|uniref:Nucleotide-diphospho-sugar transferase domain-containing protein n=1 Tax=Calothrix parasitica NIES-267 TaxID=1973488 RepID=A0A1Z4LIE4_9CYAN|nr:hypothetical protein NIES267_04750 [Calothrix parasitica NIES-267]
MITFVTFHVDIAKSDIEQDTPLDSDNFYNYQKTLELMFSSVSKFHHDFNKVILTDLDTDFSFLPADIHIQRYAVDSREIMFSRLSSQLSFLESHDFDSDIIFLDSDILINQNLEPLFKQNFDIALTIRVNQEMPINGGIIYISKNNRESANKFFNNIYDSYINNYKNNFQWWGDQYALADVIGWTKGDKLEPDLIEVDGIKILLLACDIYNFSPDYESDLDVCELKDKKILHFKGPRKKYMDLYWQYYLSEQDPLDWQKKYNLLLKRFEASQADRLDMKAQIHQLNQDNSYLRNNLKAKIKSLRRQNEHLQNKNKELTDKLDLMKEKSEQL